MAASSPTTFANIDRLHVNPALRRACLAAFPVLVAIALAFVGAFGSYVSMDLPVRLAHFTAMSLAIGAPIFAVTLALRHYVFPQGQPLWATMLVAIVAAPPGGWIVQESLRFCAPQVLPHVSPGELMMQVLFVNLFIGLATWLLRLRAGRSQDRVRTAAEPPVAALSGALRAKLPIALRHAAILALSAEDHYVRVRTDRGQALILMNLVAAIGALGPCAGVRIHRSHWIARELAPRAGRNGVPFDASTLLPISRAGRKLLNDLPSGERA